MAAGLRPGTTMPRIADLETAVRGLCVILRRASAESRIPGLICSVPGCRSYPDIGVPHPAPPRCPRREKADD